MCHSRSRRRVGSGLPRAAGLAVAFWAMFGQILLPRASAYEALGDSSTESWPVPDPNASVPFPRGGYGVLLCGYFDFGYAAQQQLAVREAFLALKVNLGLDPCDIWVLAHNGDDSWTEGLFDALPATAADLASTFQAVGQRMWDDANTPRNLYVIISGHGGHDGGLACDVRLYCGSMSDSDFVQNHVNLINSAGGGSCPIECLDVVVTTCYGGGFIDDFRDNFHGLRGSSWPNARHLSIMTASDAIELSYLMFAVPLLTQLRNDGAGVPDLDGDDLLSIYEYYDYSAKEDIANPDVPYTPYVPGTLYVEGENHFMDSEHPLYYEWNGCVLDLRVFNSLSGTIEIDPLSDEANRLCYACGTEVTLTAQPIPERSFRSWTIWTDPNQCGDANFAVVETNCVLHLTMDGDCVVEAAFRCGSDLPPFIAMTLLALAAGSVIRRVS
ncbi:MAG: hypothetical protein JXQ73_01935 [Phycisphaerae bacterium]|nr:hypothetical protein [Phycisphaerae bacterium]